MVRNKTFEIYLFFSADNFFPVKKSKIIYNLSFFQKFFPTPIFYTPNFFSKRLFSQLLKIVTTLNCLKTTIFLKKGLTDDGQMFGVTDVTKGVGLYGTRQDGDSCVVFKSEKFDTSTRKENSR